MTYNNRYVKIAHISQRNLHSCNHTSQTSDIKGMLKVPYITANIMPKYAHTSIKPLKKHKTGSRTDHSKIQLS